MSVLFTPAFQIHVMIEKHSRCRSEEPRSVKSHKPHCRLLLNYVSEPSVFRETRHRRASWLELPHDCPSCVTALCFSFASGELCDEVINHCVPDLNPCQHESKCLPLDKGTR